MSAGGASVAFSFDEMPPELLTGFHGPTPLVRRALPLPAAPGVYVVAAGDCLAHVGTSGNLRSRVRSLAALGTHRGSAEVVCAAYCTGSSPHVWWIETADVVGARRLEAELKRHYGEPPVPRAQYAACVNGRKIAQDFVAAAGAEAWEAGYAEALFAVGEKLSLLFQPRFARVWAEVGVPPGPWAT